MAAQSTHDDAAYDLICVGFGPASLSIAAALHDADIQARVLFLEKQSQFAWHSGMLLPGSHMQISFLKDMATFRNPQSKFTFLSYLQSQNRLVSFANQSTFYPLREEFNDYLQWCASHFDEDVHYGEEVQSVSPVAAKGPVKTWNVVSRNVATGAESQFVGRHIVVAVGGRANIPEVFQGKNNVLHSSRYLSEVNQRLPNKDAKLKVAVVGGGQSAVEIFQHVYSTFPNADAHLILRQPALKPSDDSPFVNEIFDPEQVDTFFSLPQVARQAEICRNQATNYSVVRLELIDSVYQHFYAQRLRDPKEPNWKNRIIPLRDITEAKNVNGKMNLTLKQTRTGEVESAHGYDLVVLGTGYMRNTHREILKDAASMVEGGEFVADRSYRVMFKEGTVSRDSGIWLQGCCEQTHGLSDTLLSILAIRGGQIAQAIFGSEVASRPIVEEPMMAKL